MPQRNPKFTSCTRALAPGRGFLGAYASAVCMVLCPDRGRWFALLPQMRTDDVSTLDFVAAQVYAGRDAALHTLGVMYSWAYATTSLWGAISCNITSVASSEYGTTLTLVLVKDRLA